MNRHGAESNRGLIHVRSVCRTDLQEQQEELRQRRRSAEDDNAATSRHIRQTNPKLRCLEVMAAMA